MTPPAPIPTSLADACAAHDRHRLDVLDALLDEAAPTAVRELLGAALDLCATLRADRDELRAVSNALSDESSKRDAQLAAARQVIDEERATVAWLTARVAELEARPVLTEQWLTDRLAHLGYSRTHAETDAQMMLGILAAPLMPAQDRAEELIRSILRERKAMMSGIGASLDDKLSDTWASEWINATRSSLASLGAPATTPTAAPGLVAAVSVEELAVIFARVSGHASDYTAESVDNRDRAAARAVLARLDATTIAPVDPEAVARSYHDHEDAPTPEWEEVNIWRGRDQDEQRAAISAMRATLTAAGIPVTPEVGK